MNLIETERILAWLSIHSANDNSTSAKPTANLWHSAVMHRNEADKRGIVAARVRETIAAARVSGGQQRVRFARTRTRCEIGESARRGNAGSRADDENDEFVSGIGERARLASSIRAGGSSIRVQIRRVDGDARRTYVVTFYRP